MNLSEKAQASLDKVVARFQAGDLSPIVQVASLQIDPTAPANQWSFGNRVMAFAQSGQVDCRGFRQWEAAGRKVKKGTKAAYILRPRITKQEDEDEDGEEQLVLIGFSGIPVWGFLHNPEKRYIPEITHQDV